jgi:formylmethanofuran dehydrogenase subunit B
MQTVGEPTCTLGEVRNRSDLLIFWGCNPLVSHTRHFSRYSAMPKGKFTPQGRKSRTIVVVDVRPTKSTKMADIFVQVKPGEDFAVLTALRALVKGKKLDVETVGGVSVSQLEDLAEKARGARFGVFFMGMGLTQTPGRDMNVSELFTLVAELNRYARFSVIPMRGHGNVAGADQVLTWQSGFPFAVSYAQGYPQYGPGEFSAVDVLARGEADAALILSSDPVAHFPVDAARHLERIPTIVLDPVPTLTTKVARVFLPTACYGVDAAGTAYRMDGVPIRLRPVLPLNRPTDEQVLDQIIEKVM